MTEKEKMLSGLRYTSRDPELINAYHRARRLIQAYNHTPSAEQEKKDEILSKLLKTKGKDVWIESPFYCDYGEHISIGENTFVNANCFLLDNNTITIGKNGLIGPYVQIYTASHPLKASERIVQNGKGGKKYVTQTLPVTIGDNVWIGGNTVILPGVIIGDDVTIGAGSVVTKHIPSGVLAYGNPCKVRRKL